jgi:hypothetical protein
VSPRFIYDYPVVTGAEAGMPAAGPVAQVAARAEESGSAYLTV